MPEVTLETIEAAIADLRKRAARSQAKARKELNPLFDDRRPPRDFVESSYLYIRSCDADVGSRPLPCPVFWLSPDLRIAPLSNLGAPTTELQAGDAYRLTATVRNRGDLMVPSAKVEFWLVNPSLGFDTRFATKLGVAAGRVQAHGSSEVSLDYVVSPALSGHRCLFARVFSFSPLDLPIDDFALDPRIDRHIGQLNLSIVGQATSFTLDWIHLPNAAERLELVPMTAPVLRAMRLEAVTALTVVSGRLWKEASGGVTFETAPAEGPAIAIEQRGVGLGLVSNDPEAVPLERQAELTKQVQAALRALERGRGNASRYRKLFGEYREMTAQAVRTQVTIGLPKVGLKAGQAVALNVIRRSTATGDPLGGVGLLVRGLQKRRRG
jgi:hypothetical protein